MLGLIVFVKNIKLGEVKTRIAQEVGNEEALRIYKSLLTYTHQVVNSLPVTTYVYYGSNVEKADIWKEGFVKRVQHQDDLGARMHHAIEDVLSRHQKVVLIGSDCPTLKTSHLIQAYQYLSKHDVVLGPSKDGGYYLVGMKRPHSYLFEDMTWSHDGVLQESIERMHVQNVKYRLLETLPDIDYHQDYVQYGTHL